MRKLTILLTILAACGGSSPPGGPHMGMMIPPDPTCGAHGVDVNSACYCGGGYTGTHCEVAPPVIAANEPCTAGGYFCEGSSIKLCGASGKQGDATLVKDCSMETVMTECAPCAATGAPACQAPIPTCAGSVSGDAEPVMFSSAGCSVGTTCTLSVAGMQPESGSFHGTIANFGHVDWLVNDMAAIGSGVPFKLNDPTGTFNFNMTDLTGVTCQNTNQVGRLGSSAPRPGSVKLTFDQIASGQPLTFDVEGPLFCAGTWTEVTAHVQALWQ
jgi:hypothetical protein